MRAELPPETGVGLVNRLDAETDRLVRTARQKGGSEPRAAHAADALVDLVAGNPQTKARGAEVVIVCDVNAHRRGEAGPGEVSATS